MEKFSAGLGPRPARRQQLFDGAQLLNLPALVNVIETATDTELEHARLTAMALFRYLPLMARVVRIVTNDDNAAGLAQLQQVDHNPQVSLLLVPAVVSLNRAGMRDHLDYLYAVLQQAPDIAAGAQQLLDMPNSQVEANLSWLSPAQRVLAQRIVDAAADGQLSLVAE